MHKSSQCRTIGLAFVLIIAGACDSGGKSKTPADLAADSALRADLALANRDTMVVDSIGRLAPEGALADASIVDTAKMKTAAVAPMPTAPLPAPSAVISPPSAAVHAPPPVEHHPTPAVRKPATVVRKPVIHRTTGNPCDSPVLADQKACLSTQLAAADQRLNGIYRALIVEMRRRDPSSVPKLRSAQRAFLVSRDAECRKRGAGKEGALWAYPRVHCLGQFSDERANELADEFSRLTAR